MIRYLYQLTNLVKIPANLTGPKLNFCPLLRIQTSESPSACANIWIWNNQFLINPSKNLAISKKNISPAQLSYWVPFNWLPSTQYLWSCCCCLVAKLCLTLLWPHELYVACQTPWSIGFFKQVYWSVVPFLIPGDLPSPGIQPASPTLTGRFFTTEPPGEPLSCLHFPANENSKFSSV